MCVSSRQRSTNTSSDLWCVTLAGRAHNASSFCGDYGALRRCQSVAVGVNLIEFTDCERDVSAGVVALLFVCDCTLHACPACCLLAWWWLSLVRDLKIDERLFRAGATHLSDLRVVATCWLALVHFRLRWFFPLYACINIEYGRRCACSHDGWAVGCWAGSRFCCAGRVTVDRVACGDVATVWRVACLSVDAAGHANVAFEMMPTANHQNKNHPPLVSLNQQPKPPAEPRATRSATHLNLWTPHPTPYRL
jgi:hypothetical protein